MPLMPRRLPVAALEHAIERHGGLGYLVARTQVVEVDDDAIEEGGRSRDSTRLRVALHEARGAGGLTHRAADRICVDYLRRHPCEVFGEQWFELTDTEHRQAEAAERRETRAAARAAERSAA